MKISLLLCSDSRITKILHSVLTTYTIELIIGYDFLSSACDFIMLDYLELCGIKVCTDLYARPLPRTTALNRMMPGVHLELCWMSVLSGPPLATEFLQL